MLIITVDKYGEEFYNFGFVEEEDLIKLAYTSSNLNFKCFPFVEPVSDTTFNTKQMQQLQYEVKILKNIPDLNQELLGRIEMALQQAYTHNVYVQFFGD